MKVRNVLMVAGLASALFLVGCEEAKNTAQQASNAASSAAKSAGDAAKSAGQAVADTASKGVEAAKDAGKAATDAAGKAVDAGKDAAKGAADAAKGAVAGATDAAAKALESLKADGAKWMTDTVEKQWPGMKTELEGLTKKVADIKDAGIKTKAEGLVKDLQGQIPAVEKMVGDLKNFKEGDFGKLFEQAKTAWDGFSKKMGDLKALLPK